MASSKAAAALASLARTKADVLFEGVAGGMGAAFLAGGMESASLACVGLVSMAGVVLDSILTFVLFAAPGSMSVEPSNESTRPSSNESTRPFNSSSAMAER